MGTESEIISNQLFTFTIFKNSNMFNIRFNYSQGKQMHRSPPNGKDCHQHIHNRISVISLVLKCLSRYLVRDPY